MGTEPWHDKPHVKAGPNYPASYISWERAVAFCKNLTIKERSTGRLPSGWIYALPTDAQWEFACRAGTTSRFYNGEDSEQLDEFGWGAWNAKLTEQFAKPVGQKKPNAWRLYDLMGNVYEWNRDSYSQNQTGGVDPWVAEGWPERVARGGAWQFSPLRCRSAHRAGLDPTAGDGTTGIRVAQVQAE